MVTMPCKDCEKRQPACHDTCPEYKAARDKSYEEYLYNRSKNISPVSTHTLNTMIKRGKWAKGRQT